MDYSPKNAAKHKFATNNYKKPTANPHGRRLHPMRQRTSIKEATDYNQGDSNINVVHFTTK